MKKLLALITALSVLVCGLLPAYAEDIGEENVPVYKLQQEVKEAASFTPETQLPVKSAILMEQESGKVLYEQNADLQLHPASVTKIMSLLLIMEAMDRGQFTLTDMVTCSDVAAGYGGSQIWLKPGEQMSVDDLLKATAIASANDATVCLAEFVAGSETAFVTLMNERAQQLGMTNTVFKCAEGLDAEGHVTTSRDIAIMSRELLKHEQIKKYTTTWMDSLRDGATQLVNTNRMVRFYDGATGLKTGTTSGAGSCLSASAERNGLGLIAVVMGAATSDERFASARGLLDWGYANYTKAEIKPPHCDPMPVKRGVENQVEIKAVPPKGVVIERNRAEMISQTVQLPENIEAPVLEGQEIGKVFITANGEQLAEYPLCAAKEVKRMTFPRAFGILFSEMLRCS